MRLSLLKAPEAKLVENGDPCSRRAKLYAQKRNDAVLVLVHLMNPLGYLDDSEIPSLHGLSDIVEFRQVRVGGHQMVQPDPHGVGVVVGGELTLTVVALRVRGALSLSSLP